MRAAHWSAAAVSLLACSTAPAHHSFARFDLEKNVTIEGTVKEFQFTNPHVWIQLLVPDGKGTQVEWSIEAGAPGMMIRQGWKGATLKPGDKITLTMHPLRDGNPSGSLVKVVFPDGRVLGSGGGPPPPPPPAQAPAKNGAA